MRECEGEVEVEEGWQKARHAENQRTMKVRAEQRYHHERRRPFHSWSTCDR